MFSPSDYDDAVPKFTNGNYANTPLNPLYVEEPDAVNYNRGAEPLQTLPAQWWNWLCNKITSKLNNLNTFVKNIFDELAGLLSVVGETPNATSEEVTTGQLKDMFESKYPIFLGNNFIFESVLQGRTRGVMLPPSDTWNDDTNTLSLSGGFGILDTYKKIDFANSTLVLPNDGRMRYIVSDADGTLSIERNLNDNVILIGLCANDEYCLLIDNNPDQCKDNIILKKWFGQNRIKVTDFLPALQAYYNTSIYSFETTITIESMLPAFGSAIFIAHFNNCDVIINSINGGVGVGSTSTFNNCNFTINSVDGSGAAGIGGRNSTYNNCNITINSVNGSGAAGIGGVGNNTFNNCNITIGTVGSTCSGIMNSNNTFNNCYITINSVNGGYGINVGTFNNCIISIGTVNSGAGMYNNGSLILYLTRIICTAITSLANTGGKLNVLNNAVLHAS